MNMNRLPRQLPKSKTQIPSFNENENMETWVPKLLDTLDKKKVKTIKATGDMLLLPGGEEEEGDHDHGEEGHHHEYDPHVWYHQFVPLN